MRTLFTVLLLAAAAAAAEGHEYWLSTNTWRSTPGDSVVVRAMVGEGFRGELKPYASERAVRFTFEGTRTLDLAAAAVDGETEWARVTPVDGSGAVVCYESNSQFIELPAPEFDRYLALEGLEGPLATRKRISVGAPPGRELYRRACKMWLPGPDSRRITRPYGLPLEIVPEVDPMASSRVTFQVLYEGKPVGGALVRAWRRSPLTHDDPVEPIRSCKADREGRVSLDLRGDGRWLISTVHMVPAQDPARADWQSTWASLTFAKAR